MSNENPVPHRMNGIDSHLGRRLRLVRELSNLSQSDLAQRMEISVEQLARYEIGNERIPARKLFEAANIVEVPGPWFFEDLASAKPENITQDAQNDAEVFELQGLIRKISNKTHLADLKESAQNRLYETYNIVNQ